MAKKRGKAKLKKPAKKTVKNSFKEKKVKYTDVKSSSSPKIKDEELNRELNELETGEIYGTGEEKKTTDDFEKTLILFETTSIYLKEIKILKT